MLVVGLVGLETTRQRYGISLKFLKFWEKAQPQEEEGVDSETPTIKSDNLRMTFRD